MNRLAALYSHVLRCTLCAGLGVCWLIAFTSAHADDETNMVIEEIIVTAQKRENLSQKVPISLFAESGHLLRKAGIDSVGSLGDLAAGVETVSENSGKVQMVIRGVTNLVFGSLDATAAVGYYVDETPLSSFQPNELPDMGLWDVERVEVLRGPQGTLFGESSMGGTVRVITRKPDPLEFGGSVVGLYESITDGGMGYGFRAMLNAPLINDELALRVNLTKSERPGYIDIPDLGIEDANDVDISGARVALGWTPNDRTDVQLSYIDQAIDLKSNSRATSRGELDPQNEEPLGLWAPLRRLSPQENRSRLLNLTIKYDFDWGTFVSATSNFDSEQSWLDDYSWVSRAIFGAPGSILDKLDGPIDSLAQEFRLSSINEKINWTIGVFFKKHQLGGGQIVEIDIPDFEFFDTLSMKWDVEIDSYALFGEVDYKLSEQWAIQAGGRYYSNDQTTVRTQLTSSLVYGTVAGATDNESASTDDFAPSIGLSWTGEENLFFVRAAKGFRAGGINLNSVFAPDEIPLQFDPEELWAYETGIKSRMWDNRLQLNAYVYLNRWDSIQIVQNATSGPYYYNSNGGKAEALGTELELTLQATENLTLGAFLALINTEMKETILDPFGGVVVQKGNKIPLTPESSLSLIADSIWPITSKLNATAFARWTYRSGTYSDILNTPAVENTSYDHVFVRFGVEGASWAVYLSVDNLFDQEATVLRKFMVKGFPLAFSSYVLPRTVKLELRWDF